MSTAADDRSMCATIPPGAIPPLVVMGVSGSGKSTIGAMLAERLGIRFVDGDDLHPAANVAKMSAGIPLDDDDRRPWLDAIGALLASERAAGRTVVVACSALRRAYRDRIRRAAPDTLFVALEAAPDLIEERMEERPGHFMPPSMLASQLAIYEPPGADENAIRLNSGTAASGIVDAVLERLGGTSAG